MPFTHVKNGFPIETVQELRLGMAKSKNGVDNWQISSEPLLVPATMNDKFAEGVDVDALIENEAGGLEDARITKFGDEYRKYNFVARKINK